MKGTRNLLWLVPFFLVIAGPFWWPPVAGFLKPRGEFNFDARSPEDKVKTFALEEMVLTQSRGNQREMRLQSQRVFTTDSDELLQLEKVEAELNGKDGDTVQVVSGKGVLATREQKLTLLDDVLLTSRDDYVMHTSVLVYTIEDKELRSDEEVRLASGSINVSGTGMTYDMESGVLTVGGRVHFEAW